MLCENLLLKNTKPQDKASSKPAERDRVMDRCGDVFARERASTESTRVDFRPIPKRRVDEY